MRGAKLDGSPVLAELGLSPVAPRISRHLARIEVGVNEVQKLFQNETFLRVAEALQKIGYAHVTLDLQGYRRGSLNEPISPVNPRPT